MRSILVRAVRWFYMYGGVLDQAQDVTVYLPTEIRHDSPAILGKIDEALLLMRNHDRPAYEDMLKYIGSIDVIENHSALASWSEETKSCLLNHKYALEASAQALAGTLVHESMHAKLMKNRIGYGQEVRARVEAICHRRSLRLLRKLPGNTEVEQAAVVRTMEYYEPRYSDREIAERKLDRAQRSGIPRSVARLLLPRALRRASHSPQADDT